MKKIKSKNDWGAIIIGTTIILCVTIIICINMLQNKPLSIIRFEIDNNTLEAIRIVNNNTQIIDDSRLDIYNRINFTESKLYYTNTTGD